MYVILIGLLVSQALLVAKLFSWKLVGKILGVAAAVIVFEFLVLYGEPWLVFIYLLGLFALIWSRIKNWYIMKNARKCYR